MAYKRTTGRKCKFESLEDRRVLAGNVFASVEGGTATIEGDRLSNRITITAGPNPFEIRVTGLTTGGAPTQINGVANAVVTLRGVTRGLEVEMGNGNNIVAISGITIFEKVSLESGSGVDTWTLSNVKFRDSVNIETGKGADVVTVSNSTLNGKTKVESGSGYDEVTVITTPIGALNVALGNGNDRLAISGSQTIKKTTLSGGKGIDVFGAVAGTGVGASNFFANYSKRSIGG